MPSDKPDKPLGREQFATQLAANAAAKPFNLVLLVATLAAVVAVGGGFAVGLPVALAFYLAACLRTFFDSEEADRVLAAHRGAHAARRPRPRLDATGLAPEIRGPLLEARAIEARIGDAIRRAELPYTEVDAEVDALLELMDGSARRAQLLHEGLADAPPAAIERRLATAREAGKAQLVEALDHQLAVQRRMTTQLERFTDEMERVLVELETIRGALISVSASTDTATQDRLAADVRSLRDELSTLASGMSEVYEQQREATP